MKQLSREEFIAKIKKNSGIDEKKQENFDNSLSTLLFWETASNGRKYGIIKENKYYFIKTSTSKKEEPKSSDFAYIGGLVNKLEFRYPSYADALKNLNFKIIVKFINIINYR